MKHTLTLLATLLIAPLSVRRIIEGELQAVTEGTGGGRSTRGSWSGLTLWLCFPLLGGL